MKSFRQLEETMSELKSKNFNLDLEKMKKDLEDMGPRLEKEMEKAKGQLEKAKEEIREYNEFVGGLENDGLLNRKKGYSLKYADGVLLIDGNKADQKTLNKYNEFLNKHDHFEISNKSGELEMNL